MQSVGVGDYVLGMPQINCAACFKPDPALRMGMGAPAAVQPLHQLIDTDSELMGITRKASNCPLQHYLPSATQQGRVMPAVNPVPLQDCRALPTEDTRLSNPPCTLRGHGWNRWEWLCQDPQRAGVEIPFVVNVSERTLAKDNHRPCVQKPMDPSATLPPLNGTDDMVVYDPASCGTAVPRLQEHVPRSPYWGGCRVAEVRTTGAY